MNGARCEDVRGGLPDLVGGRMDGTEAARVAQHLAGCAECREEQELVSLLFAGRPRAPVAMAPDIERALRFRKRAVTRPWWGLAAAAVAAVALGIGVTADGQPNGADLPAFVADAGESSVWLADDGMVAGAPALSELSDEALLTLLEEMTVPPSGGAA